MREHWDNMIWDRLQIYRGRFGEYLTLEQLAALSGAPLRVMKRLEVLDLIHHVWIGGQPMYPAAQLPRVRKALRFRYDLGVSWSSMDLVLHLSERVQELEERLDQLQQEHGSA